MTVSVLRKITHGSRRIRSISTEVCVGLAPALVQANFELIQQIHSEGVAIFMVEQNANMALSIADRGWVLQTGKVVLDDNAEALLANPDLRASYLGETD